MGQPLTISVNASGVAEYTRNNDFQPFDGRGKMERVTDIKKREDENHYFIHWMMGPFAGTDHTYQMAADYNVLVYDFCVMVTSLNDVVFFNSYNEAVKHEVDMINAMRKAGVRFSVEEKAT